MRPIQVTCALSISYRPHAPPITTMSSSIQSLLKTEKEAAEIVNEARKYRTSRLKSAKSDAQKEIDEYKAAKDTELKQFEEKHLGINELAEKEADAAAEKELQDIKSKYESKKSAVVQLLVDAATKPTPELHINA